MERRAVLAGVAALALAGGSVLWFSRDRAWKHPEVQRQVAPGSAVDTAALAKRTNGRKGAFTDALRKSGVQNLQIESPDFPVRYGFDYKGMHVTVIDTGRDIMSVYCSQEMQNGCPGDCILNVSVRTNAEDLDPQSVSAEFLDQVAKKELPSK